MRYVIAIVLALAAAAVSASALPAHQTNEVLEPAIPKSSSDVNITLDIRNRPADVRTCICSDHDLNNDEQITEVCCGAGKIVAGPKAKCTQLAFPSAVTAFIDCCHSFHLHLVGLCSLHDTGDS